MKLVFAKKLAFGQYRGRGGEAPQTPSPRERLKENNFGGVLGGWGGVLEGGLSEALT